MVVEYVALDGQAEEPAHAEQVARVLPENVRAVNLLVAPIEQVLLRDGVLVRQVEGVNVVLDAVFPRAAEDADGVVVVVEQEAAEVGVKRLPADADVHRVVVVVQHLQLVVDEGVRKGKDLVRALE